MTQGKDLVDELAKAIADKFYWLWEKGKYRSRTKWTKRIMEEIGTLGEEIGCDVYVHEKDFKSKPKYVHEKDFKSKPKIDDSGEWLFDMTWIKRDGDKWEVVMAMESEWDPANKAFDDDFEKLMVARCRLRVMSFTFEESMNARVDYIKEKIKDYYHTSAGDCYLCVGWPDDKLTSETLVCKAFEVEESCGSMIFREIQLQ